MDRKQKKRKAPIIEALEPRVLFSADMFGGAADNPVADDSLATLLNDTAAVLEKQNAQLLKEKTDAALTEPLFAESNVTSPLADVSPRIELVFVDTDTPEYQQLIDDMLSTSDDSRRFEVILLDNDSDGIEQISAAMQGFQGIDAIHVISHGEDGAVDLGNTQLNNQNLAGYQAQLQSWAEHLSGEADILFYGCDLAASADGQALIDKIATLTGADIAASDDLTGNADLGGDWELEYNVGQIEAQTALSEQVQVTWQGSLSQALWLSTDSNVTSSGANGLDSWTEGQVLEFSGASLAHGEATAGDLSLVIDFDTFTLDSVDAGALHFVSHDMTVGGANGTFDLKAGDVLVSFLQDETILAAHSSTGADMLVHDQDLLVFRPDAFNDYSAGTFTVLLNDVVADDLKGVTLIEQDTTIGGTDIAAGSFLLIAEVSGTTSIDLFVPTGVGLGTTTGTTSPLIDISQLGIEKDMLRGIEVIEAATTIGGQSLAKGDILATLRNDAASVGSNGLSVTQNDVFVLSLTSTGMGTTAGTASMFLDGSDVGLDNSPSAESPYALALHNYSQLTVDTTSDVADGDTSSIEALLLDKGADGKISLREAIVAANATPNGDISDTIRFNITDALVGGAHTISVGGALPSITDTLVIDGTSEPDFSGTPVIRIDGASATGTVDGLSFSATSDYSIVRGLMITGFTNDGIFGQAGADYLTFTGNWIGTSGAGSTGVGNGFDGIDLRGSNATIGGTGANEGNVITNSGNEGINIAGTGVTAHLIQGNYIGLDPDGVSGSGNTDVGIAIMSGSGNTIGGTSASARNVISNNVEGIEVNTSNNVFQGNYIGTDAGGTLDRGNRSDDGIEIQANATGNLIGGTEAGAGNLIAFNARDGVNIVNGSDNTVLGNLIHSNSDLGIDLGTTGVTSNDANDGDTGANNLQNYPAITTADLAGSNLTLSGTLDTNGATTSYRIEFFGNTAGTQDATHGEGRFFLGSTTVTTNGTGDGSFNDVILTGITLNEGDYVTATATRVDDAGQVGSDDRLAYGDTSEFAANVVIANGNNAPVLSGANDLNSINEDDVNNSGTLVSDLIAGQVSDADSGSSGGIAVVGVDNTNGTWEYTTNGGGVWTAFGSPSTAAARLLADDVNTLVRFVPDADWNGTVTNGITFRAWDQTSGANGSSVAIDEGTRFTLDEFSSVSYSNNNGTNVWSTDWVENDSGNAGSDPANGRISVSGNELKFQVSNAGNSLSRGVNLENATSATLSFSYDNTLGGSATLFAQVSSDGGTNYDTVATFNASTNQGIGTQTVDISSYIASNTQLRFFVGSGETGAGNNKFSIDNVQVEYTELGGGSSPFSSATASASVVVNAMADTPSVTNASTNEDTQSTSGLVISPNAADGSEVTHYKVTGITDGTLYKNDGVTQINNGDFITVAEGSAGLKYTPTVDFNGSGNFTVQASASNNDAGLGGDTTVATINVAPVNDAPTDLITTSTSQSGLSLNEDGNDSYLVADNGLPSPLSQFTVEVQFEGNNFSNEVPFISYNTASGDMLTINTMADNTLELDIGTGAVAFSSAIDYNATLMDGQRHTLSVSWDNTAGDWSIYIDGTLIDSGTGLSTGQTILTGGTLMFGLEQDSVGGTFESQEYFNGELYDIRLFDDVRTATEIASHYTDTLASNEPGMVANWIFDNLSSDGRIVESVSGNNLTVQHTSGTGFTPSNPELILSSPENSPNGTVVGTLSTIDPDSSDSFSYTLVDNAGGRFDIDSVSGDITVLDASLIDYETAASHDITVRVTDAGGLSYDEIFTIQVVNTNDAPVEASIEGSALAYTENDGAVAITSTLTISDVDDTNIESAVIQVTAGYNSSEDVLSFMDQNGITGSFNATNGTWTLTGSATLGQYETAIRSITYSNSSENPDTTTRTVSFTVNDGDANSNTQTRDINITAANDAPVLAGASDLTVIDEDPSSNGGTLVSDLIVGQLTDSDSGSLEGIAVVAVDDANGTWQYTTDGGTNWTAFGAVDTANSRLLAADANTSVRFVPDANWNGTVTNGITLHAWDRTSGTAGGTADLSAGVGGTTAFSASTASSSITVNAVTDLAAQNDSFTLDEDTSLTSTVASNDSTTSGGSLSYALASGVSNGSVTLNNDGSFTYTPAANYNGSDSFTYTVTDASSGESSTQTVAITVNQVDDAGTFGGDVSATTSEDTATSGTVTFADAIDGYTGNNFALTSGAGNGIAAIDSNGNWTYTPSANYSGADSFVVQATDDDGNVATQVINITVNAVLDLTAQDDSFTLNEDATFTGTVASNDSTTSGGALSYAVNTGVSNGSLSFNADGSFTYTPTANYHGGDSFTYTVTDSDSGESSTQTVSLTVNQVDDAGTFGGDVSATTSEDTAASGTVTFADAIDGYAANNFALTSGAGNGIAAIDSNGNWTYTPSANYSGADSFVVQATDDDGNVETQVITITINAVTDLTAQDDSFTLNEDSTLTGTVASNDSTTSGGALSYALAADVSNGSLTLNNDGSFSYTPTAHYHGPDSFTYTVTDSASGEGSTQTVSLTVNQVDDAGTFGGDVSATTSEDTATSGTVTFADAIDGYTVNNFALTSGAGNGTAAIDSNGNWTYTPSANYSGADSFVVQATDDDGNVETQVINITVNAVTDLTAQDDSFTLDEDTTISDTVATNDSTISGGALSYALATGVSNGSLSFNADGSFTYTPTTNYHGGDSFTYTVTDANSGESSTQTVALTVNQVDDAGTFGGDVSATTNEDTATSGTVTFADAIDGYTANKFALTSGASNGIAAIDSNGNWTYTPSANYSGADSFVVQATDDDGNVATQVINITVNAVADLTATDDSFTLNEDTTLTGTVATNDSTTSGGALSYAVNTGVSNGSLTLNNDGSFTYTPTANYHGPDSFTYTVTDAGSGESSTQTVSLTVDQVDDAGTFGGDVSATTNEDTATSGTVTFADAIDGYTANNFALTSGASNGIAAIDSNGNWTYTPSANYSGADSFVVQATDDDGNVATQVINITVNAVADLTATDDSFTLNEDTTLTGTVAANDSTTSGGALSYALATNVSNGSLTLNNDGSFSYTPTDHYHGPDSFTYTVTDSGSGESSTQTVSLTVNQVDDAGTFGGDVSATTNEDTATSGTVTFADAIDGYTANNFALTSGASNGTAAVDSNGNWTYTPSANYSGADSFVVQATDDDGNVETQVISITVNAVTDLTATDDSFTLNEDTILTNTIATNDSTTSGGTLSYAVNTGVSNGSLSFNADGSFTYTPTANYHGSDSFTYTVTDANSGESSTQTVALTVNQVDDAGTFGGDVSATTNEDTATSGTVTFADAIDGYTANKFALTSGASNGIAAIDSNGNWTYTPSANYSGADSFVVQATDDDGNVATQVINITVNAVADLTATDDSFTLNEDTTLTGTVATNDSTTSGGALSYAVNTGVSNGSLTLNNDGSFTYTPTANYHGPDSFTYTVTDSSSGESSTLTVSLTVNSVDDAVTIGGNTSGSGAEDTVISGTLTASDSADGLTDGTYFTVSTDGTNGTASIDPATGLWSYTPSADFNGSDAFTVTVTDDDGYTATQVVTVTMTPVVDLVNDSLTTNEDTAITANVLTGTNGASADNFEATSTLTAVTNGNNGTVSFQSDGTVTYTPDANFNGNDSFTYTITSGGVTETGTVNVTVNAVNDLPTGSVTISGIAMLGEILTAANSLADADGMGPVTYTWKADGVEVGNGTTYTLTESEVGRVITVEASYEDHDGGSELVTSAAGVVAREPLPPLSPQPVSEYELEPEAESEPEPEADLETASEAEPNFAREPEVEQTEEAVTNGAEQLAPIDDEILAQVLATEPAVRDSYQSEAKSYNPVPPKFIDLLNLDLAPFDPDSNEIGDLARLMDNASFSDGLNEMKRDLDEAAAATANQEKMRAEVLLGATAGLSVGVISWVLRAGSLIAGFMSIAPLWRQIDPIPVLGEEDQEKDAQHAESEAENKVEQIFSREDSSR